MFSEIYMEELKARREWEGFIERNDLEVPCADNYEDREEYITKCSEFLRMVTKTSDYQDFVRIYIAPGRMGQLARRQPLRRQRIPQPDGDPGRVSGRRHRGSRQ